MESYPIYVPSIDCSSRQSNYQLKFIMSNTTHNISLFEMVIHAHDKQNKIGNPRNHMTGMEPNY